MKRLSLPVLGFVLLLALFSPRASAQDTLRLVTYNLLNYGGTTSFCDLDCKDENLDIVMTNIQPNIIVVNEMADNAIYGDRILQNVLNTNGETNWERAEYVNTTNSVTTNMLFYRRDLFTLYSQANVDASIRDIHVYTLFYNDPQLSQTNDTLFFRVAAAHLKAGNTVSDQNSREAMVNNLMGYLDDNPTPEFTLLAGDLNVYTSNEDAYQTLTNDNTQPVQFEDPMNAPGNWNQNSSFSGLHTQSTRTNSENDGGSGGGSDSRFDFILITPDAVPNTSRFHYVNGSYTTYGQDGGHFNGDVTQTTAVSSFIAGALYDMSDHYPVFADFALDVTPITSTAPLFSQAQNTRFYPNPQNGDLLNLAFPQEVAQGTQLQVTDLSGRALANYPLSRERTQQINLSGLPKGLLLLNLRNAQGQVLHTQKLLRQ